MIRAGRSLCRALCSGYVVNGVGLEEKISRSLNVVIELQANKSRTREVITTAKIHNSTAALSDTIWNWSGRAHLLYHYCSKMVLVLFNNYVGLNYIYSPAFRSTKFLFSHQLKKQMEAPCALPTSTGVFFPVTTRTCVITL